MSQAEAKAVAARALAAESAMRVQVDVLSREQSTSASQLQVRILLSVVVWDRDADEFVAQAAEQRLTAELQAEREKVHFPVQSNLNHRFSF
jgi:hypothetical protein